MHVCSSCHDECVSKSFQAFLSNCIIRHNSLEQGSAGCRLLSVCSPFAPLASQQLLSSRAATPSDSISTTCDNTKIVPLFPQFYLYNFLQFYLCWRPMFFLGVTWPWALRLGEKHGKQSLVKSPLPKGCCQCMGRVWAAVWLHALLPDRRHMLPLLVICSHENAWMMLSDVEWCWVMLSGVAIC